MRTSGHRVRTLAVRFVLYPISAVSDGWDDEGFDRDRLPFELAEGVRIEAVHDRFREDAFDHATKMLGEEIVHSLRGVRCALVYRYDSEARENPETGKIIRGYEIDRNAEILTRNVAACLRLIRPMRERALVMRGTIRDDGTFDVTGFDIPNLHLLEVPEVQKLFALRNQDADNLRQFLPAFVRAMRGEFWKFRMAVQFHELGHFQPLDYKARYLLWCSAIESVYTSHTWEHQGTLVATSRIKWFLGEKTSIYAPGDISRLLQDPHVIVGAVVGDLYEMRNFMAHGDKIPDRFFNEFPRQSFNGDVTRVEVLIEAASFIIRASLLKILRDGLLDHFADAEPAEAYFAGQGIPLTRSTLRAQRPPRPAA